MSIAYKGSPYENEFLKYKLYKSVILIERDNGNELTKGIRNDNLD